MKLWTDAIWLATAAVDMRTGIDGLSLHVQQALGCPPCDGTAVLSTYGRRKNSVKSRDEKTLLYHGFRDPAEIISHVVWLYFRFALSFRDIEELMASRGIVVTYETIRQWTLKFGQGYANELRRKQPQRGDK